MNTNILKEFIKLYSQLPCGVMIFKNNNLYFINNHLREVLTLEKLEIRDSINIIASILEITPSSKDLFEFFTKNSFFKYKEKYIQISYKTHEEYKILVFIKLDKFVLEDIFLDFKSENEISMQEIEDSIEVPKEEEQDSEILEYFNKNHNVEVTGIVLYKGVPLISTNIVLRTYKNLIVVKIEDKQKIASIVGNIWIINTNNGMIFQSIIKSVNNTRKFIFLSEPKNIIDGFIKRERIRYLLNHFIPLEIHIDRRKAILDIVDISENSLKALTDNANIFKAISNTKKTFEATMQIKDIKINLSCKFLKEGERYDKKIEMIFLFTLGDFNAKEILSKWLNEQQIKVINEIRLFQNQ